MLFTCRIWYMFILPMFEDYASNSQISQDEPRAWPYDVWPWIIMET